MPGEGTAMRFGLASFPNQIPKVGHARLGAARLGAWSLCASFALPVIGIAGITAWLMLPEPSDAGDESVAPAAAIVLTAKTPSDETGPARATTETPSAVAPAASSSEPATVGLAPLVPLAPEARSTEPLAEKSPLDGLRIARQSWRRGGLGSKALITLTLRNRNDFAVKDIEIACAFARRDGSHLTERKRLLTDPIAQKSRKTYSRMLVGFVNVNANKAKCSVVTASRL
ncbi:hypothetical protein [Bradyrhizobium semiaridum]|uniref:hypothetical protein n=1 Tax=Bradyrhizobium semiaridum TaxID=2821404 RepID=UPI001CE38AA7|nr:hypothetical protein [Bradyrhizobium semiaridum]